MASFMCISLPAEAQLLKKMTKKAEQAAERAVLRKTDQKVTEETDNTINGVLNENEKSEDASTGNSSDTTDLPMTTDETVTDAASGSTRTWSKYNFVPGEEIIFEDDLSREENGEFPSRWDLVTGNAENAVMDGTNVIVIGDRSIITPLLESENYLPEVFTVEFDAFFNDTYSHWQEYIVRFFPGEDSHHEVGENLIVYPLRVNKNGASIQSFVEKKMKNFEKQGIQDPDGYTGWKHIAISYNQRSLKVFIDEERVLNIPNIELFPLAISIEAYDSQNGHIRAIKNIRIAEGGKKLYDRIVAEGKFVTRGILFDVNKATLKPESMGVINEIASLMKEHIELKFSIEGHTDSDGEDAHNLKLSEERAIAVKEALTALGIDGARMQARGMGETVPVSDNASPEGKANNRRVEFVKN